MLINKEDVCLAVFSLQKEFMPSLEEGQKLIDHCYWLSDLAIHCNIPIIIINHKNLGSPLHAFKALKASNIFTAEVITFSWLENETIKQHLQNINKKQIILSGAESHIAILQSAYACMQHGYEPFVVVDAITARNKMDHQIAINRIQQANISLVSREMVFFELLRNSVYPNYINMSLKFLDGRYIRE